MSTLNYVLDSSRSIASVPRSFSFAGMGWPTFHTLDQMARHGANILVICMNCSNRTSLPGPALVRYFRMRGWSTAKDVAGRHLRCSSCKCTGAGVRPTFDEPGRAWRPPQTEDQWTELGRRILERETFKREEARLQRGSSGRKG